MSLKDFLSFKNSILCQQVQSNLYTKSILDNSNTMSFTSEAMNGCRFKQTHYIDGDDGTVDSLKTCLVNWRDWFSRAQFYDLLNSIPLG